MKKTILAVLLSAFLCHSVFAEENTGYVEEYSEILEQEANLEKEFIESENSELQSPDSEYLEAEYIESEYDELAYEAPIDTELEESTTDNVLNVLASCKEYTLEDGVEEKDLNNYLLICINNILNENGYKSVKSVPVE
jgi:hypothetical protein